MSTLKKAKWVKLLSQASFFSEVSDDVLSELYEKSIPENYYEHTSIFKKGDIGDAMYVILEGRVKIHEQNHIYGYMAEGECFGEYSIIDEQKRSATVTAEIETKVLKIRRQDFLDLMLHNQNFAQGILSVLIARHRKVNTIQESLAASKREIELANKRMSSLINGTMDAIIMFDQKFRIVLTNPSANKLLENNDVIQRNILFFMDESSAEILEEIVSKALSDKGRKMKSFLPEKIKIIGSEETEILNEGTISKFNDEENTFFTLILRNIEDKIEAENKIKALTSKTKYLEKKIKDLSNSHNIIAGDPSMLEVLNHIQQVAYTNATVLINGETGTGKELVARAIHEASDRKDYELVRINCGAIPANLIESELFGHEKGAFTGAISSRKGRFLLAHKGTIFLDEIGELPLDLQPKLLRVIQEGEFEPIGSSNTIKVDVRIVAATHRNLKNSIEKGHFREDLFYRLNVYPIKIPALRERGNDTCLIAQKLINVFATKLNKKSIQLSETDREVFNNYAWPGNVRELQNLVERAMILSQDGKVNWQEIIPNSLVNKKIEVKEKADKILLAKEITEIERDNIIKALRRTNWKVSGKNGAASLLQIPPTTLASKIKALNIKRPI